jgi:hypothetical protein
LRSSLQLSLAFSSPRLSFNYYPFALLLINMQFTTTEVGYWPPISEVADMEKEDLSLESFDKDIEAMEDLFRASDWLGPPVTDTFSYDTYPDHWHSTPSALTYSTESDSEPTPSQYSGFEPSDYSTPSDIVTGGWSAEQQFYSPHDSVYSDVISNGSMSFGSLPPSPPLNPVDARADYGTSNPYQSLFAEAEDLPFALQQLAIVIPPTPHCVQVMPDTQAYATPDRPFKCPLCPFSKANSYQNLQLAHSSCFGRLEAQV